MQGNLTTSAIRPRPSCRSDHVRIRFHGHDSPLAVVNAGFEHSSGESALNELTFGPCRAGISATPATSPVVGRATPTSSAL